MKLVLAVDLGTSWVKTGLYDEHGRLVASYRAPSEVGTVPLCASDEDLERWWNALAAAVRPLAAQAVPEVLATSVRAHVYYLFFDGDMRALDIKDAPVIDADEVFAAPGWGPGGGWARGYAPRMVAQAKWIRDHHPEAHARMQRVGAVHNYMLWRMTGRWLTDTCYGPSGLAEWPEAAMRISGLRPEAFPIMCESQAIVGELLAQAAADFGLPAGIPVACGGHDGALANLGGGANHVGDTMITLGTNAVLRIVTGHPVEGWSGYPIPPGNYAWVHGANGVGPMVASAKERGEAAYEEALAVAARRVLGLLTDARGAGLNPTRFFVTGGLSQVPRMRHHLSKAIGAPLLRTDPEAGLRGAAILAAVAAGWYSDVEAASQVMRYQQGMCNSEEDASWTTTD